MRSILVFAIISIYSLSMGAVIETVKYWKDTATTASTVMATASGTTGMYSDGANMWVVYGNTTDKEQVVTDADYLGPWETILTVGNSGEFTSPGVILAVADQYSTPAVMMITPGIYEWEQIELPDGWSLVGTNKESCIIRATSTGYNSVDARTSALVALTGSGEVANITIENERSSYPAVALATGWGWSSGTTSGKTIRVTNCVLTSDREDTLYSSGSNDITISGCDVYSENGGDTWSVGVPTGYTYRMEHSSLGTGATTNPCFWMTGGGTVEFVSCELDAYSVSSNGALRFNYTVISGGGVVNASNCVFLNQSGSLGNVLDSSTGGTWTVALNGCAFTGVNPVGGVTVSIIDMGDGDYAFGGDVSITGLLSGGTGSFGDTSMTGDITLTEGKVITSTGDSVEINSLLEVNGTAGGAQGANLNMGEIDQEVPGIEFGIYGVYDVNLYRPDANILKTDDAFDANSVKVGGTEVISSGRVLDNVTIDAGDVTAGTLSTDRYSAYSDLGTESKIGTGSGQVAAGDHVHSGLVASDGSPTGAVVVDGDGAVSMPYQCEVFLTETSQSVSTTSWTTILWSTEVRDVGDMHDVSSGQQYITIPETGTYTGYATGTISNETSYFYFYRIGESSPIVRSVYGSNPSTAFVWYFTAGDRLIMKVYKGGSGDDTVTLRMGISKLH